MVLSVLTKKFLLVDIWNQWVTQECKGSSSSFIFCWLKYNYQDLLDFIADFQLHRESAIAIGLLLLLLLTPTTTYFRAPSCSNFILLGIANSITFLSCTLMMIDAAPQGVQRQSRVDNILPTKNRLRTDILLHPPTANYSLHCIRGFLWYSANDSWVEHTSSRITGWQERYEHTRFLPSH